MHVERTSLLRLTGSNIELYTLRGVEMAYGLVHKTRVQIVKVPQRTFSGFGVYCIYIVYALLYAMLCKAVHCYCSPLLYLYLGTSQERGTQLSSCQHGQNPHSHTMHTYISMHINH